MRSLLLPFTPRVSGPESRNAVPWCPLMSRRWAGGFVLLFALAMGLRLLAMVAVPLIPEEAYYWMYAQHPSLSYFDHPPMVAWVIGLGTAIFGDTEFGVRIVGNLLMLGGSVLMYRIGRTWFSPVAGVVSALLLQILPVYFGAGFLATMDSALVFFWLLGLIGVTAALREGRVWGWYAAGFALGAALLSKYTGVFLLAGTCLAVIAHRPWRRHLLTVHPYLAFLLAVALFSPVIVWNAQHGWASFRFQFLDRFASRPLGLKTFLIFAGFQLLVATPIILWGCCRLMVWLLRTRRRLLSPRSVITLAFSVPMLSVMAYKSLRYGGHINWTLPAFLSLLPAVSQYYIAYMRQRSAGIGRQRWARGVAWTVVLGLLFSIGSAAYLLILQPRVQWIPAFGPWKHLARAVEGYEEQLEKQSGSEPLVIASGQYRLASVLAFYRRSLELTEDTSHYTTSQWLIGGKGLGYPYWADLDRWRGRDCLYVSETEIPLAKLQARFESVELLADERLLPKGKGCHFAIGRNLR